MISAVPVTETSQSALHQLVDGVARRIGLAPPAQTWLTAEASVYAVGDRRIHIGLPLLGCLTAAELSALVAHELVFLHRPDTRKIRKALERMTDTLAEQAFADGATPVPGAAGAFGALDAYAAEVQHDADGAAITAAGGAEAATQAFALAPLIEQEYDNFIAESGTPPMALRLFEAGISDVDDGWRRLVRHGVGPTDWDEQEAALLAIRHPRLADALTALGSTPLPVAPAVGPVRVDPLSVREQRRIMRAAYGIGYPKIIAWTTFERAPAAWWRHRAAKGAKSVRADVATVLGRAPVDDIEAIRVIQTQPREVAAAAFGVPLEEITESDDSIGPGDPTVWLIEDHLLRRGWRLEHPAVRGILTGPDGQRIDGYQVLRAGADSSAVRHVFGLS